MARRRYVEVTGELWVAWLATPDWQRFRIHEPLPPDAKLVGIGADPNYRVARLWIESDAWTDADPERIEPPTIEHIREDHPF